MEKPLVSIIVPVYNSGDTIERCVKSALNQTYKNIEIILINDGSNDNSLEICEECLKVDKRIKLFSKKNGGVSSARNFGLEKASGEYVFFLDADDTIDDGVIKQLINNYKEHELVGSNIRLVGGSNDCILRRGGEYCHESIITDILTGDLQGFACGCLFVRGLCHRFDEKIGYCEDMVFLTDYLIDNDIRKISFPEQDDYYYNYFNNINSATLSKGNIIKKLDYIDSAMCSIYKKVGDEYSELIGNKKNELFEAELQHANKCDIRKAVKLFSLSQYYGRKKRIKIFFYLYQKKRINGLLLYYVFRRTVKKTYSWIKKIKRRNGVAL